MNNQLVTFSMQKKYRVVQKKIARSLMQRHFLQPFAVESRGFHQNARKRLLSTSQW